MIRMIVDYCRCHMIPADQCECCRELIVRGIPPDELTYEVLVPPEDEEVTHDLGLADRVERQHR